MKRKTVLLIFVMLSGVFGATFITSLVIATGWGEITVVAIQPEFHFFVDEADFRTNMTELMEQAMVYEPDIVQFPEWIGFCLFGLQYPTINEYNTSTEAQAALNMSWYEAANVTGTAYLNTFSTLAEEYNVYTIAGSILLPDGEINGTPGYYIYSYTGTADPVYNVAYFFDPDGYIIGTQKKVHLTPSELEFGLTPSTEDALQVFDINIRDTHVGVGIAICFDAWFDSVGEILVQKGADILFEPSFFPSPSMNYDPNYVVPSAWNRSQNQLLYGVLSCLVGRTFELNHTGKSAITAPIPLTENKDGFINIADTFNTSTVVHGVLDIPELLKLRGETVGGIWIPVDKFVLLTPWIILAVAAVAITVTLVYAKKRWTGKAIVQKQK